MEKINADNAILACELIQDAINDLDNVNQCFALSFFLSKLISKSNPSSDWIDAILYELKIGEFGDTDKNIFDYADHINSHIIKTNDEALIKLIN